MKRVLKIVGLIILSLVGIVVVTFAVFFARVETKRNAKIDVTVTPFALPTDPALVAEGKRLVQVKACADCHDVDMGGRTFINEAPIGVLSGSNLTPGNGSVTSSYSDADWIRAIRYGIHPTGRPLIGMPSSDYHGVSDEDLGKMIAYLKTLPPVDRESLPQKIGPVARVLYNLGQLPLLFPYEEIDLDTKPAEKVEAGPTVEYGKYLAQACTGCHGPGFSGGHIPGTPPNWPDAKNLTPSGAFANWTQADFKKVLMEGLTPAGHQIDPQFMPWKSTQAMNDMEIEALFKFLKQLPPRATGTR